VLDDTGELSQSIVRNRPLFRRQKLPFSLEQDEWGNECTNACDLLKALPSRFHGQRDDLYHFS